MLNSSSRARWPLVVLAALVVAGLIYCPREWSRKQSAVASRASSSAVAFAPASESIDYAADLAVSEGGRAAAALPGSLPPAASAGARALFSFVEPAGAAALTAALPAPARVVNYVRLDPALVEGKSSPFWQTPGTGRVELPLPEGGSLSVVIEDSQMLGADRFTSTGHLAGHPESRAIFSYNAGFMHASVTDAEHGSYALRTATAELSQFYKIDSALVPPCVGALHPMDTPTLYAAALAREAAGADAVIAPATAAAESPQRAEVHVLMAYTQSVLPTLTGTARTNALQSAFDAAIAKTNDVLSASLITARVKLVGITETQYNESASAAAAVQNDALTALATTTDGKMDELHALRDRLGADIVVLAIQRDDSASIGVAYILDEPSSSINPQFAFAIVHYPSIAGTTVVPHELGHVFGCAHERGNSSNPAGKTYAGAYPFSYGYSFTGADGRRYRDIMAYNGSELGYFSSPRITAAAPVSRPIGIAAGQSGESDASLTIERTAFEVSTFRLQTTAPANVGTLINVATRAFVGGGEAVLIGGFVINGSQPKKVLFRGAGPALQEFGVSDALVNPVLRVFSRGTVVAENDNWSAQAGASEVASTSSQVGAFPFVAGSADAALITTLAPGDYTAVVESANGATGSALVEVYEADRNNNRIVNLATRGYVDRGGKEMFGGFVIQGSAGTTKRVLVRVLGPTLNRDYGIGNPLNDPQFEIRNSAGELIVQNDDWSGGSSGSDFSPRVTTYGEKAITATGYAPPNRREPCVLVDLPPGAFTVIVRPFELLPDQVGQPGVAIVEVYEINN